MLRSGLAAQFIDPLVTIDFTFHIILMTAGTMLRQKPFTMFGEIFFVKF